MIFLRKEVWLFFYVNNVDIFNIVWEVGKVVSEVRYVQLDEGKQVVYLEC